MIGGPKAGLAVWAQLKVSFFTQAPNGALRYREPGNARRDWTRNWRIDWTRASL